MSHFCQAFAGSAAALVLITMVGCAYLPSDPGIGEPVPVMFENPALVPVSNADFLWEEIVDAVDDHFPIDEEFRVRQIGDVVTEGYLETHYVDGSTLFEPHRRDSYGAYNKLEATLQTIRRRARIRVIPDTGGYRVEVAVFKELEDLRRPLLGTTGSATFRSNTGVNSHLDNEGLIEPLEAQGWIPLGRDTALEQLILEQVHARTGLLHTRSPWQRR